MSSRKKLSILCLDFDGVLHGYQSGWQGAAIIPDPPVPGAIEFLHAAVERFQVAVYSSRSGQPGGIDAMRGWLMMWLMAIIEDRREAEHVISLVQWPTEKPAAIVTIDDRAIQFTGEWPSLDEIAAFQPWNKRPATSATRPQPAGGDGERWKDDPSADERWNAGLDYGQQQLCAVLGVDPQTVSWDAATETLDGDVRSVIGNILTAWAGDNWRDVPTPAVAGAEGGQR